MSRTFSCYLSAPNTPGIFQDRWLTKTNLLKQLGKNLHLGAFIYNFKINGFGAEIYIKELRILSKRETLGAFEPNM